jgi:hypothetical protein
MRIEDLSDAEIALRPHHVSGPVAETMLARGAIAPGRAVTYAAPDPGAARDLARWREAGVVKATSDGRIWFDLRAFYTIKAQRERLRAMIAVPLALVLAMIAVAFYAG